MTDAQDDRTARFERALARVGEASPPGPALRLEGILAQTIPDEEWAQLEDAERELLEEMVAATREAARSNPKALEWLRRRGLDTD